MGSRFRRRLEELEARARGQGEIGPVIASLSSIEPGSVLQFTEQELCDWVRNTCPGAPGPRGLVAAVYLAMALAEWERRGRPVREDRTPDPVAMRAGRLAAVQVDRLLTAGDVDGAMTYYESLLAENQVQKEGRVAAS